MRSLLVPGLLSLLALPAPADAAFHVMKIREIYAGADAQYVVLQMFDDDQNFVGGHEVTIFNAAGTLVQTNTFPGNVNNGTNQAFILVGTATTQTVFGVAPDLVMPAAAMSAAGGKACFDTIDCVAWGNYSGSSTGVGTPAAAGGIPDGNALRRDISGGNANLLEAADDTNVSTNDFDLVTPDPHNNPGTTVSTTTTLDGGTSTTTTITGGSTTTTTLGCEASGPSAGRCVIATYPPAACAQDTLPAKVANLVAAADRLLGKVFETSSAPRARRFQKRAAARLLKAGRAATKAGMRGKISSDCAAAVTALCDDARNRVLAALP